MGGWLTEWACDDQSLLTPETNVSNFLTWGQNKHPSLAQKYILVLLLCRSSGSACVLREIIFCGVCFAHTFLSGTESCCQLRFGLCNVGCESKTFLKNLGWNIIYLINESVR